MSYPMFCNQRINIECLVEEFLGQKMIFFPVWPVTVNETSVHYYEPENKIQLRQWVGPESPRQ